MGALPDLEIIRTHVGESYHFSSWNRYVHPDEQDLRRKHAEAHTTGKVRDGHTHANLQRPFADSKPPLQQYVELDKFKESLANCIQARAIWADAEAYAQDVVNWMRRQGMRVIREVR